MSLARNDADKLNAMQDRLQGVLGFRPTLSQTLVWLIQNAHLKALSVTLSDVP